MNCSFHNNLSRQDCSFAKRRNYFDFPFFLTLFIGSMLKHKDYI